jgi:hypothetical protein
MKIIVPALLLLLAPAAHAEEPQRGGFTLGLSLGGGAATMPNGGGTEGALGGLNLFVGGFVTPRWALAFKFSGVNYGPFDSRLKDDFGANVAGVGGPAAQFWVTNRIAVNGGFGYGVVKLKLLDGTESTHGGFGLIAGVNVNGLVLAHHGLGLYFDLAPIFTSDGNSVTYQGGIAWQWY